jgi:hypothetical protein
MVIRAPSPVDKQFRVHACSLSHCPSLYPGGSCSYAHFTHGGIEASRATECQVDSSSFYPISQTNFQDLA